MAPSPAELLQGPRVRLRAWQRSDRAAFAQINADAEVMLHFQAPLTREQSDDFADRIASMFERDGYGLWALQTPELEFAGFVGIFPNLPFVLPFPGYYPAPREIGWRLARAAWGQGYATEAASLALAYAWQVAKLPRLVSFTAASNKASQAVMQRIGMHEVGAFEHPNVPAGHALRPHVLYAVQAPQAGLAPG
jgi:RimJ/RimL family protein N-acetyltransferase